MSEYSTSYKQERERKKGREMERLGESKMTASSEGNLWLNDYDWGSVGSLKFVCVAGRWA